MGLGENGSTFQAHHADSRRAPFDRRRQGGNTRKRSGSCETWCLLVHAEHAPVIFKGKKRVSLHESTRGSPFHQVQRMSRCGVDQEWQLGRTVLCSGMSSDGEMTEEQVKERIIIFVWFRSFFFFFLSRKKRRGFED